MVTLASLRALMWLPLSLGVGALGCADDSETSCAEGTKRSSAGMCVADEVQSQPEPDTASDPQDTGTQDTGSPSTVTPLWSVTDVQSAIQAPLEAGFFGPEAVRSVFLERMSHGDGRCPDSPVQISDLFVYGCTTEDGWWFAGIATYEELGVPFPWDGTGEEWSLSGDFEIIDPEGMVYRVGGETGRKESSEGVWAGRVQGSWSQEDHAHPWISGGMSAMLSVTGSRATGASKAVLHGGLGIGQTNLYFENLRWKETGCWSHPTGTIMARDPSQYWWSLELDKDCTGCGKLSFSGQDAVTEICPELGDLRDQILDDMVPE